MALLSTWQKDRFAFGGSALGKAHARGKRPFSRKLSLHIVLRSSQARGEGSFFRHEREIFAALQQESEKRFVRVEGASNAGNHLHLLVKAPSRDHLNAFLRALSGRIAMIVTGAKKGLPAKSPFWDQRPFSRIVGDGRDHKAVLGYLTLNATERLGLGREQTRQMFQKIKERMAEGLIPRSPELVATGFG